MVYKCDCGYWQCDDCQWLEIEQSLKNYLVRDLETMMEEVLPSFERPFFEPFAHQSWKKSEKFDSKPADLKSA